MPTGTNFSNTPGVTPGDAPGGAPGDAPGGGVIGRVAPTPSGRLHLGNVCAAGAAWLSVRQRGGRLRLRMEDVDAGRARRDIAEAIRADLAWLGLAWDDETPPQSSRDYAPALARLAPHLYRCTCTRAA